MRKTHSKVLPPPAGPASDAARTHARPVLAASHARSRQPPLDTLRGFEVDVRIAANNSIVSLERERIDCAIRHRAEVKAFAAWIMDEAQRD